MSIIQRVGIVGIVLGLICAGIGVIVGVIPYYDCGSALTPHYFGGWGLNEILQQNDCAGTLSTPTASMWTLIVFAVVLIVGGVIAAVVKTSERAAVE